MEDLNIIEIFLTIGVMVAGWFLRMLHDNHKTLEDKVNSHQLEAGEKFVRRDDYRNDVTEIKAMLDKIFNRLDEKADK